MHAQENGYKKAALIGAAAIGTACIAKLTYDYLKPRSHAQEIAHIEKTCQEAERLHYIVSHEYEKSFALLSESHDRYQGLKTIILAFPHVRPFTGYQIKVSDDIYRIQNQNEAVHSCATEINDRIAGLTKEKDATTNEYLQSFKKLKELVEHHKATLNQLYNQLELINRMTMSFTEYTQEDMQQRIEKLEKQIKDLQRMPHPMPVYIHHYH